MWAMALIASMFAQLDYTEPQVPIAGIVGAPGLFGAYACDRFVPEPIDVYEAPSRQSARLGVLETRKPWYLDAESDCEPIEVVFRDASTGETEELLFREFSYESMGLVVDQARGDWLHVASRGPVGWIERPAERYHPYEQLLGESLSYLTSGWPGGLWVSPGTGRPVDPPSEWAPFLDEPVVEVLESRRIQGDLWFRVQLDADYGCGERVGDLPTLEGWIPAYGDSGAPHIWFHSRGC